MRDREKSISIRSKILIITTSGIVAISISAYFIPRPTFLVCSVIFLGILMFLFLEKFVISRFARLNKDVQKITGGDMSTRLKEGAQDEIGKFASAINLMLNKISSSQEMNSQSEKQASDVSEKLKVSVAELENTKRAILNLLEDIQQEKNKAEAMVVMRTRELNDEKARLIASINSLSLGFIIADLNDKIILKNPAISSILDITGDISSLRDIADHFDKFNLIGACKECVTSNKVVEIKDVSYGKKYLRIFCAPIRDSSRAIGYVFLAEDVTEAKIMERSRDEFFAVASHELRTPLTAIMGNAEMVLDLYADKIVDKDMREMISDINLSSVRLIEMVNDFLEMSRLEQGRFEMKPEAFDVTDIIVKVVRDLQTVAAKRNLSLSFEQPKSPLPKVMADKNRVEQILVNLIGNSLKFTKQGGVTIMTEPVGQFVKISVKDTGIGVSEHNQTLLFRKFQQAGEQMLARDVTQSTGLGLYICKLIMSNMGGSIWLEHSELDKGSVFAFTLPAVS